MSVFDQSFNNNQPSCFGIRNGDRQSPISSLRRRLEDDDDDLRTSEDRQKKQEIEDMLAQAMKVLTFQEQQEQQEILHGVDQKIEEEETFISVSLHKLESHLEQIKSNSVYEMAERMDPAFVRAKPFRLMFLRGNRFDIKESAENMLKFFEMKRQLFGVNKLVKDITVEDLDEDDIATLKTGFFQLAGRDRSGRLVCLNFPGLRGNMALRNELRMRYYILMSALQKEGNQNCSLVAIIFSVGEMKDRFSGNGLSENAKVAFAMPSYVAALHLCSDQVKEHLVQATILKAAPLKIRSRSRLHFGSQTECLYSLKTFGIPEDLLPVDPITKKICLKRHMSWIESRFAMERKERPLPAITPKKQNTINPSENDVLVGIGKKSNNMGNHRLRALVKELSQAYNSGSKETKKALVDCAIKSVEDSGGRFLREQNGYGWNVVWEDMPRDQIRKNVAQAFRNNNRRRKGE